MLIVKKLLTKVLSLAVNPSSATIASGLSGEVYYMHFGRLCVVSGIVNTTGALSAGAVLVTGLPSIYTNAGNFALRATNNSSASENVDLYFSADGEIRNRFALSSASRSLRFCTAYLTRNVGGGTA